MPITLLPVEHVITNSQWSPGLTPKDGRWGHDRLGRVKRRFRGAQRSSSYIATGSHTSPGQPVNGIRIYTLTITLPNDQTMYWAPHPDCLETAKPQKPRCWGLQFIRDMLPQRKVHTRLGYTAISPIFLFTEPIDPPWAMQCFQCSFLLISQLISYFLMTYFMLQVLLY